MKLCCDGEAEQPRFTESGRAYCPVCHRPVRFKVVTEWLSFGASQLPHDIEMVIRHRSDGVGSGARLGIPNKVTGLK